MPVKPMIEELDYFPDPAVIYGALREEPYSSFLDSGMDENKLGRFSFIGYSPFMVAECKKNEITVLTEVGTERVEKNPFDFLKETLSYYKTAPSGGGIPFTSGCIGYFSYDLRYFIEKLPSVASDDLEMPDFTLSFYDVLMVFDNLKRKAYISSSGLPDYGEKRKVKAKKRLEGVKRRIGKILTDTGGAAAVREEPRSSVDSFASGCDLLSNFTKEGYFRAIEKAKRLITRGDIYQVNLSQRFVCGFDGDPFELYLILRRINPAPFAAYLNLGQFKILSASPERFVRIKGRDIETRPIKGTRPRGDGIKGDTLLKEELLSSAKDRAEHVMIVDLERSDIGRICEYGTVTPSEFIILETYATVHHLVSTVAGRLRKGTDIVDCLQNCFPGGSITGAPKVRSMEVIEELEPTKRGIYTGSIGYIDFCGDADLSIVIRTIVVKGNKAYFQIGGGIVADSDPENEYQETLDKGRALAEAIRIQKTSGSSLLAYSG